MIYFKDKDGNININLSNTKTDNSSYLLYFNLIIKYDFFLARKNISCEISDLKLLYERLIKLYEFKFKEILFYTPDERFTLRFSLEKDYSIKVSGKVLNDDNSGKLEFIFFTDQSCLYESILMLESLMNQISDRK